MPRSPLRASARAALLACAAVATFAGTAGAHGDVRGALLQPVYGGGLKVGGEFWVWDASFGPQTYKTDIDFVYFAVGAAYGVGPNTIVAAYVPWLETHVVSNGTDFGRSSSLKPWSAAVQQRVARWDGEGSRVEAAVVARGYFYSPGQDEWFAASPTNYSLAAGANHYGLRDLVTLSAQYMGAGESPFFTPGWTLNSSLQLRPSRAILPSGRDLLLGMETTFSSTPSDGSKNLTTGPIIEAHPLRRLSVQLSYALPVWDNEDDVDHGGSLWLHAYWQR